VESPQASDHKTQSDQRWPKSTKPNNTPQSVPSQDCVREADLDNGVAETTPTALTACRGKPSTVDVCAKPALATHCRRPVDSSFGWCRASLLMCVGSGRKKSRSRNLNGDVWVGSTREVRRSFLPPQILAAPHQEMIFTVLGETLCNDAQKCCGNQAGKRKRKSVVCSQDFE
jgi:hypothetical protein